MPQRVKSFFSFLSKKKFFFLFPTFVFAGLFFTARSALAGWTEDLANWVATRPILLLVHILVKFAIWVTGLAGSLLNWVLSPDFINLPYTTPGSAPDGNPIIEVGLGVTKGFVNMILVLVLVYIAIVTILNLAKYETKKLLITFIIIALLVNFAPLICGVIVDASNIVMNFFIEELRADTFAKNMGAKTEDLFAGFSWGEPIDKTLDSALQLIVMAGFLFVLTFILLLFTMIFILRYLVIWLLVILSPLAFACYILPETKKYFEQWWKQFLSWSFIGVTCGFFLYLGLMLVVHVPTAITAPTTGSGGIFDSILPYFVCVVFLGIGIVFGLQTSAAGASTVVNFAKTRGKAAVRGGGKGAGWVGGKIAQRGIRPVLEKMKAKEAVGKISRAVEKVPVARWFLPEPVRKYGQMRPAIEKGQQRAKAFSSQTLGHRILKGADVQSDATGSLVEMIERGDAEDLFNEARKLKVFKDKAKKMGKKKLSDQDILESKEFKRRLVRPLQMTQKGGMLNSKVLRQDPRLARLVAGKKWAGGYKNKTPEEAVQEATRQARRQHINQMEREVLEDKTVVETMMEKGREVPEAVVSQVKKGQETMLNTIDTAFSEYIDDVLSKTNTTLANMARKGDPKNTEVAWKQYREYFKGEHQDKDGYFKYMEGQRAKEMGWRTGQYKTPDKRDGGLKPTTPGGAAIGPTPSDTGEAKKKPSKYPDTGESKKREANKGKK